MFKPRPSQAEILEYTHGWMGIMAVPGAGKTHTLSALATKLLTHGGLVSEDQEILIVTLVNSAVGNFTSRINQFLADEGLLSVPINYRVRTLHGLAKDILSERPELVGLDDKFTIVDEGESQQILNRTVNTWIKIHGLQAFKDAYIQEKYHDRRKYDYEYIPKIIMSIASQFIRQAKDWQLTPYDVTQQLESFPQPLPLARIAAQIYNDYQEGLEYRGGVDFQDLIALALRALEVDPDFLTRLQTLWPYILEDEAQDSSELQEKILRKIAAEGNWVRVGDSNQAIYETFTTANPQHLRDFVAEDQVTQRDLPNSGRSQPSIIQLANYLIDWSRDKHPVDAIRNIQPLGLPYIEPTPLDDPQRNPEDNPNGVWIYEQQFTPDKEAEIVTKSVKRWLEENPNKTVAILSPRHQRGYEVIKQLQKWGVDYIEMLRSTTSTREVAGAICHVMKYLTHPNPGTLSTLYQIYRRDDKKNPEARERIQQMHQALKQCKILESYLNPLDGEDWLDDIDSQAHAELDQFRQWVIQLHDVLFLPIDQMVLTLGNLLFKNHVDLAIAYALSVRLRREHLINMQIPERSAWDLASYITVLKRIAKNEQKFFNIDDVGTAFDPDVYKGKVTVATMHGAKGLEWDRVYLMSVSNYDFPSNESHDSFMSEKWCVRNSLNLEAETHAQLEVLRGQSQRYIEGEATESARVDYASERLRLLYVGITRAREELVLTWNSGRRGDTRESTPMIGLRTYWEQEHPSEQTPS